MNLVRGKRDFDGGHETNPKRPRLGDLIASTDAISTISATTPVKVARNHNDEDVVMSNAENKQNRPVLLFVTDRRIDQTQHHIQRRTMHARVVLTAARALEGRFTELWKTIAHIEGLDSNWHTQLAQCGDTRRSKFLTEVVKRLVSVDVAVHFPARNDF